MKISIAIIIFMWLNLVTMIKCNIWKDCNLGDEKWEDTSNPGRKHAIRGALDEGYCAVVKVGIRHIWFFGRHEISNEGYIGFCPSNVYNTTENRIRLGMKSKHALITSDHEDWITTYAVTDSVCWKVEPQNVGLETKQTRCWTKCKKEEKKPANVVEMMQQIDRCRSKCRCCLKQNDQRSKRSLNDENNCGNNNNNNKRKNENDKSCELIKVDECITLIDSDSDVNNKFMKFY